jgi:outer membrane lipoprotein SlyB
MLNWYTHNSYLEIPMSQHMALYFDSRAEKGVQDSISSIGQVLANTPALTGIGGIVGGMMGGPLGMAFGSALGSLGGKLLGSAIESFFRVFGTIVGIGAGFS